MNDPTFPSPVRGITTTGGSSGPSAAGGTPQLSPSVVVIIVLITVVFFLSGFLHLLARCFARPNPNRSNPNLSRRNPNSSSSNSYQGQLQQLFHLHDSGVEQAFIDALPVFLYRAVRGLKDAADCAVCLNEFGAEDRLRLLPKCSHAFHIECIDTWLLSHSTCPLCRCSLVPDQLQNPLGGLRVESFGASSVSTTIIEDSSELEQGHQQEQRQEQQNLPGQDRVVPVKLGRFNPNPGNLGNPAGSRRSYSMGSYEYVLDSSAAGEQQVAVALISPTPIHKRWVPRGTPGHRAALSESIPGKEYSPGGSPWVTIDIDARPMLPAGGAPRAVNWVPWRRGSKGEKSFDSERGKSFSFRLGEDQQEGGGASAVWWWKNSTWGMSSRRSCSESNAEQDSGTGIGNGVGGGPSWDQASICSTNAEMKSTGSAASSMTTVSIARRTLQWFMRRDKHHRRSSGAVSGEDVAVVN